MTREKWPKIGVIDIDNPLIQGGELKIAYKFPMEVPEWEGELTKGELIRIILDFWHRERITSEFRALEIEEHLEMTGSTR